ncbi:hypothetical protein LMG10661_00663 [Ralstonia syzygii subsp. syzygii]|nr:hypothetical protein LMG10661_00663 [Ralstonia syzygii subsp. syzygii]
MDAHRLHTAARLANIRAFHVMELAKQARELELAGRSIIHMGIGEPDFTAAEPVVRAAEVAMRRGVTQYTGALGIRPLREAIARYYHTVYGLDISPPSASSSRPGRRRRCYWRARCWWRSAARC